MVHLNPKTRSLSILSVFVMLSLVLAACSPNASAAQPTATTGVSTCTGGCATNWPALLTNGTPVAGDPAITGTLGVITRSDGSQQVTINGMPLYHYANDMAAGDTNGQGVGSVWFVVQPSGTPMQ